MQSLVAFKVSYPGQVGVVEHDCVGAYLLQELGCLMRIKEFVLSYKLYMSRRGRGDRLTVLSCICLGEALL